MCGIAAVLYYGSDEQQFPIGQSLLTMSTCLQHRGADSAGIAVFSKQSAADNLQVVLPPGTPLPEPQKIMALSSRLLTDLRERPYGFSATVTPAAVQDWSRERLVADLEQGLTGSTVVSLGRQMSIYKAVGEVANLAAVAAPLTGTHGISHLRLATESRIDSAHAQPFWGRPYPDIAVTHNGHITNYYKLRQKLEGRGFTFASANDSEIIGILIGEQMEAGSDLSGALRAMTTILDGSYSFIVATSEGLGVARDSIATKPLLYVETDLCVAIASEQQALHHLLGEQIKIKEVQPKEIRTWAKA